MGFGFPLKKCPLLRCRYLESNLFCSVFLFYMECGFSLSVRRCFALLCDYLLGINLIPLLYLPVVYEAHLSRLMSRTINKTLSLLLPKKSREKTETDFPALYTLHRVRSVDLSISLRQPKIEIEKKKRNGDPKNPPYRQCLCADAFCFTYANIFTTYRKMLRQMRKV